jgi:hypothetical protein
MLEPPVAGADHVTWSWSATVEVATGAAGASGTDVTVTPAVDVEASDIPALFDSFT